MPADLCFTFLPDRVADWPRPFLVAARSVLLCPTEAPKVLILGYGLGAIGAKVAELRPRAEIVGVEVSKDLFRRAQRFLLRQRDHGSAFSITLQNADALTYLRRSRRHFDLILDDCFTLRDGIAERPSELTRHAALIRKRLSPGGVYLRNLLFDEDRARPEDVTAQLAEQTADLAAVFPHLRFRRFREWDNVFALASDWEITRKAMGQLK